MSRGDPHLYWDTSWERLEPTGFPKHPSACRSGSSLGEKRPELGGAVTQQARHDLLSGMQSNAVGKTPGFPA